MKPDQALREPLAVQYLEPIMLVARQRSASQWLRRVPLVWAGVSVLLMLLAWFAKDGSIMALVICLIFASGALLWRFAATPCIRRYRHATRCLCFLRLRCPRCSAESGQGDLAECGSCRFDARTDAGKAEIESIEPRLARAHRYYRVAKYTYFVAFFYLLVAMNPPVASSNPFTSWPGIALSCLLVAWFVACAFAVRRLEQRAHRFAAYLRLYCPNCTYDTFGAKHLASCPECGLGTSAPQKLRSMAASASLS